MQHGEVYGGASAGYVMLTNIIPPRLTEWIQVMSPASGSGYTIGLQLGGTYFLTQRIGLNAELQGNYMSLLDGSTRLFEFPGTIGIRCRMGKIAQKTASKTEPAPEAQKL